VSDQLHKPTDALPRESIRYLFYRDLSVPQISCRYSDKENFTVPTENKCWLFGLSIHSLFIIPTDRPTQITHDGVVPKSALTISYHWSVRWIPVAIFFFAVLQRWKCASNLSEPWILWALAHILLSLVWNPTANHAVHLRSILCHCVITDRPWTHPTECLSVHLKTLLVSFHSKLYYF
jgi:hypothetical protein